MPLYLIIALVVAVVVVFWDVIKKILPVLLLLLALAFATGLLSFTLFPAGTSLFGMAIGPMVFGGTSGALLAAGAAFLLFPDETAAVVADVASAVGDAAGSILAATADAVSTGLGAFLTSPVGLLVLGFGVWYFFIREKRDELPRLETEQQPVVASPPSLKEDAA